MEQLMSLRGYVRQLKPFTEKYIPPVDKVQSFFVESSLSKSELEKPAGAGPNSGRPRIEIFADKIRNNDDHILNDGETIVIKQITMDGEKYSPKDMDKLLAAFPDASKISVSDPATAWSKIAKTPEYGGRGGGEKISESTQELMTAAIVISNKTYDAQDISVEDAKKIIEDAKSQWSNIKGATGKEALLNQFTDNWYDLATAVSSANAISGIVGTASDVFWTGQSWDKEIAPFNPPVKGVKDYNSSDIVVKGSDGIYYGFSLKKKASSGAADPTLINKPITGKKSLLKPIIGDRDYNLIELAKNTFFDRMLMLYYPKKYKSRGDMTSLSDRDRGKAIRAIPNTFANDMLAGRKGKNVFWYATDKLLKKHAEGFVKEFLKLVFRIDLNDMIDADVFKFYLLTGIGRQKGDAIGVEPAEVKDMPSTIEALTKIFDEDNLKLGTTLDKKGTTKKQPWEYKKGDKKAPAKLFYTIYNGSDALLNIELRYKGSKTAEPQFQATATPVFKNLMGVKK